MATPSQEGPMVAGRRQDTDLAADFKDLMQAIKALVDPYRPELHYMRGPGPKWHAKHDPAPRAESVQVGAYPAWVK